MPAKYIWRYKETNGKRIAFTIALGDLAPAGSFAFDKYAKPLIEANQDLTYTEYYGRGLEDLPEEGPAVFDWMDRHKREALPKKWETVSARSSEDRSYGVVIRQFGAGATVAPEAVTPDGGNIKKPANLSAKVNAVLNLLDVSTDGVSQADIWVPIGPVDFSKKLEVRLNGRKTLYKGPPPDDFGPILQDLRVRGDRKQLYGMKVSTAGAKGCDWPRLCLPLFSFFVGWAERSEAHHRAINVAGMVGLRSARPTLQGT